jgi:NitT/TauT family transport system substrate-binding protein
VSVRRQKRTVSALCAAVVIPALVAGCTGSSEGTELATGEDGLKPLRVTTLGLCNEAIVWGLDQGVFADHGIDVQLVTVQSGAAGIAALQSGDTDVAFVNTLSAMQAVEEGVEMRVVSGSGLSTEGSNAVIVGAQSPVTSAKDLQGQTIAINQLGGLGQIVTQAWIAADAGAPSAAEFVTLPFADQVPAVANGTVAAAQVTATQVLAGVEAGTVKSLGNPFFDGIGPIDTAVYLADTGFTDANTQTMTDFADAMTEVANSANDTENDADRFPVMAASCKSTPEVLASTPEPLYEGRLDMSAFDAVLAVLTEQGQVTDIDVDALVPDFARADR